MGVTGTAVVAAAVVAGAVIYPGFNTADVDLNDGSVWVTNRNANMVGHLNAQSKVLDGGFVATTSAFDVLQHEGTVFMDNDSGTLINQVNVPSMALTDDTPLSGSKHVSLGSSLVSMSDAGAGKVWVMPSNAVAAFNDKTSKPVVSKVSNVQAAVALPTTDGVSLLFVLDPQTGALTTSRVNPDAKVLDSKTDTFDGISDTGKLQLTTVADKAVVLDPVTGTLYLPGNKKVSVPDGKDAVLQQRSATGDSVGVETAKGLFVQPLNGGQGTSLDAKGTGRAIAPVQQGSCFHGAWMGTNKYMQFCPGGQSKVIDISKASGQAALVFRQNRDVVVLNDMNGGDVWLVNQNMLLVNNWQDLIAQQKNADNADKESSDPNVVNTLPDRTKPNRPPIANPDNFGVRAGTTTLLPVLYNDSDPDGDVLTVSKAPDSIEAGDIQTVYGGTGLQITVPADAPTGTETFNYTAYDGRGGSNIGRVTLRVVPQNQNAKPISLRPTTMVVAQGESITQNVLADMIDPDGDDIFLVGAKASDTTGEVKFTPDGQLTYSDNGQGDGIKTVTISVSDQREIATKVIKVNVKPAGGIPPVANADYVRVVQGQTALIQPLKNDQDPNGGELRLASVDKPASGTISGIKDNNAISFTSDTLGPVYLTYQVTNGPQSATGLIRVDVVAAGEAAPIAVRDIAMLPTGGTVLVDVLGNDTDPAGGVLVVKSVEVPPNSGLTASVLDHNVIKLTDFNDPGQPVTLKYEVANGQGTSSGLISVLRLPASSSLQPPVAKADAVNVRVGDVARIPVLANDYDPNGDVLKHPVIMTNIASDAGKLWVDQDGLRVLAGNQPGSYQAIYKVTNKSGQSDSASVNINVIAADPEHNLPPAPKAVEGRVIAGTSTRIMIPLEGIDPDGDSVQLMGVDTPPSMGTAEASQGYITYTASGIAAGTDTFTYKVQDRLGAQAIGTVTVGVAKADSINHPPQANDDFISMRPGRKVAVDVILNDSDPDGTPLHVLKNGFTDPAGMNPIISPLGRVIVTAPEKLGISTLGYTVGDPSGAIARANIRMTVSPTAPLLPPIARDDTVTTEDAMGKNTVKVNVLKNDDDPDGVADELKVTLARPSQTAKVNSDGTLQIQLTQGPQMIPYTVTDQDKLNSTAIVWVPGLGQQYPVLSKKDVIKVNAGSTATLKVADYVKVRDGRKPLLTQVDKIRLIGASGGNVISSDGGSIVYKAKADFYGPGSITFEVTDGNSLQDPNGLKSTLTVMTDVVAAPAAKKERNVAPKVQSTQATVAQLDSTEVNLALLASDPEGDSLKYSLAGATTGDIKATLNGTLLKIEAGKNAVRGSVQSIAFEVSDGKNPAVKAVISLTVTSSNKPLPVANDDTVADAHAGRLERVSVLSNDVNPFPETPLKIVDTKLISGAPGAVVQVSGSDVNVTAPENFTGNLVVSYTIRDKTDDPARAVSAKISLNVKGKPAVPTAPRVEDVKSKQVTIKWVAPANNGSPITSYTVKRSDGVSQECATNTCVITGLTNAKPYTFAVSAKNDVGESAFSPASAKATPDQRPDQPAPPTAVRGDKQLEVSWVTPVGEYSPVETYNLRISPAPSGQNPIKSGLKGNKYTWTGLTNGEKYTFQVQAVNKAPEPSTWSQFSYVPVSPAGKPFAPSAPSTSLVKAISKTNMVKVSWNEPNLNGGLLKNYTLNTYSNGAAFQSQTTTNTTATLSLPNGTAQYTFKVVATTEVSASNPSTASAPRRSVSKPEMVQNVSIVEAGTSGSGGQIKVNFSPLGVGANGGSTPAELQYIAHLNPSGAEYTVQPGSLVPAPNGAAVTVAVRAKSSAFPLEGDASTTSNQARPYGAPGKAKISGNNGGTDDTWVTYSWSSPSGNVNSASIEIKEGANAWQAVGSSGTGRYNTNGYSKSVTIKVRSKNSVGTAGDIDQISLTSGKQSPPKPTEWKATVNGSQTCLEDRTVSHYTPGKPASCSSQWLATGQSVMVRCWADWGDHNWFTISSPGYTRYPWVRADTTDLSVSGIPQC